MSNFRFNNNQISKEINEIIEKGYTVKAGTVSGNSIEVLENCQSYVYYENTKKRDEDLMNLQHAIADAK